MNNSLVAGLTHLSQMLSSNLQQLRIHRAMAANWGYSKLASCFDSQWQACSFQLDNVLCRFVALDQTIDLQNIPKINVGQTVEEMLQSTSQSAKLTVDLCHRVLEPLFLKDQTSFALVQNVLFAEEKRNTTCATHVEVIRQMGLQNFLLKMSE
jgi:bacterioferritin (cytochrome b1)